ncbi:phosphatidylcholine synthase [Geodermatophilus dictyosporus]|uniref:Phosphatidylcholine synthase n=1 Tax=Geodermatophilus dictyosporus TaxID=1523247 RepID=A0A1I5KQM1_9ACTN|nr:CDP-alcohol phosphatidyltransferase family protein [Geodermatophilus dictyosporus]SFO87394.1 phosphatidylcholine synthase [Geodermatophilus dictyosporus]
MRENAAPPVDPQPPAATAHDEGPDHGVAAARRHPLRLRLAGAAVHAYTALGSVLGLLVVLAALEGEAVTALWIGLAALVIDGTDGMLARRARVKETIPWFDGALLDNIVDYLTYVFAPVVLLWTTGALPHDWRGWLLAALPLLASSYQFCRVDAKTDDHTFLGFPSYWNVVAFYAVVLDLSQVAVAVTLVVCSVLVFVPVRYLYPSRTEALWQLSMLLTVVWLVSYAVLLVQYPDPNPVVVVLSFAYLVYYLGFSGWLTARAAHRRRRDARAAT